MPTKSASKTIARDPGWLGPAIPPGEILLEEYLKPLGLGPRTHRVVLPVFEAIVRRVVP